MPYTTANPPTSAASATAPWTGQARITTPATTETNPTSSSSPDWRRSRRCRTEDLDEAGDQRPGADHNGEGDRADAGPDQCQDTSGELEQAEQQADPPAGPVPTADPVR